MKKGLANTIFFLQSADEMRHPYEAALGTLDLKVVWFTTIQGLADATKNTAVTPTIVIVDLDALPATFDVALEQLKTQFKASDLIALSSSDSAQLALQCLRSGFSDYILKPASPEELGWSIRKRLQSNEVFQRLEGHKVDTIRAITQISNCASPSLVLAFGLEYIYRTLGAEGAAWIQLKESSPTIACAIPKGVDTSQILFDVPSRAYGLKRTQVYKKKNSAVRKLFIPSRRFARTGIFVWGIPTAVSRQKRKMCELYAEQSELTLINIEKFEQIKQQTFVDDLTGLYNSRYLKFALTNAIVKCKEPGQSFSVLFIDVDHFKKINDTHGHLVGSEFLVTIGKTVRNAVRRIDPVFRYGGDEFVVILNDTGIEGATEIAERIRRNIERRIYVIKGQRIQTTVSIGIANYPEHAREKDTLLKLADEAMYSAKKGNRNSVHLAISK